MEKKKKTINVAILVVTMLIITICSVISSGVMYIMLKEERNKSQNINVDINKDIAVMQEN